MLEKYFAAKNKIYPQKISGRFRRLKWRLNFMFLVIYCFAPFLRFNRGPNASNQAILIDLPSSRAYFFGIEIWPQDVYYLAGILIIAAVALFFITSLFGRIWCGYACFQTVWTDIFIAVERLIIGNRNDQILLDRKKFWQKIWLKLAVHFIWIAISLLTGLVFTFYFNDSLQLIPEVLSGKISFVVAGWIVGIAAMTYLMAGFAREHVCTFMCPYARFQSAMFDDKTLIIAYDQNRGEPRGKLPADKDFSNRGHCIDCKQCVVVCPTGIDIRNGLQMECIACGLCIDACDDIMKKIGLPTGLIRYDSTASLQASQSQKIIDKPKLLRPRTIYYATILFVVSTAIISSLILKPKTEAEIIANRNPAFIRLSNGSIRNDYLLKIFNKTHENAVFELILASQSITDSQEFENNRNHDQLILKLAESDSDLLEVEANSIRQFKFYLIKPRDGEKYVIKTNNQKQIQEKIFRTKLNLINKANNQKTELEAVFINN